LRLNARMLVLGLQADERGRTDTGDDRPAERGGHRGPERRTSRDAGPVEFAPSQSSHDGSLRAAHQHGCRVSWEQVENDLWGRLMRAKRPKMGQIQIRLCQEVWNPRGSRRRRPAQATSRNRRGGGLLHSVR